MIEVVDGSSPLTEIALPYLWITTASYEVEKAGTFCNTMVSVFVFFNDLLILL